MNFCCTGVQHSQLVVFLCDKTGSIANKSEKENRRGCQTVACVQKVEHQRQRELYLPRRAFHLPISQAGIRLHPLPTSLFGDVEQRYRMRP